MESKSLIEKMKPVKDMMDQVVSLTMNLDIQKKNERCRSKDVNNLTAYQSKMDREGGDTLFVNKNIK